MSHTALARKYRPRRFSEVAVQEHASTTLRRAVATDRVGHAYLFCGPRGVGKTTLARVLAMALNCPDRTAEGEPCGICDSCTRTWSGTTSLDVVEIDAASNRGVDDARDLRERAMYAPSEAGRSKVYIVDEAHMLTREAWNALLKILEEPPPRVIFIFATTEPQKIEQTAAPILSRCQRFDFRRLGVSDIVTRLEEVVGEEGINAESEALRLIARKADGGMRDGLSILDQVLALSEGGITAETVRDVLGVVTEDQYLGLFDVLIARDDAALFDLVQVLVDEGYDLVEFYQGLMENLRNLLRLRVGGTADELALESVEEWRSRAETFMPADLIRMLGMAAELETEGSLRRTQQPRVLIELLLLRFTHLDRTVDLERLVDALGGDPDSRMGPRPADRERIPNRSRGDRLDSKDSEAPSPEPESAVSPAASDGPTTEFADPVAAWTELMVHGRDVPRGILTLLRGAEAGGRGPDGIELRCLPEPAKDRLLEEDELKVLERALSSVAGRDITIRVQESGGDDAPGGGRISVDQAREGRLQDLLAKEPGLRPAVEELDLELLD